MHTLSIKIVTIFFGTTNIHSRVNIINEINILKYFIDYKNVGTSNIKIGSQPHLHTYYGAKWPY